MKANNIPLAKERRLEILAELKDQGSVRVTELAKRFSVAEETIRRDLDRLSDEGRLSRTHGGALSIRNDRFDLPLSIRKNSRAPEKRSIALKALSYIKPNDVVAFDASTTVLELACLLPNMPLTIVTYALDVARLLIDRPEIKVIVIGGELDAQSICLLGSLAEANLRKFEINKAFFSCKGIDLVRGYSEASLANATMKEALIEVSESSYLLADHTKFGVRSMAYYAEPSGIDELITDDNVESNYLDALEEAGVTVTVAQKTPDSAPTLSEKRSKDSLSNQTLAKEGMSE